MKKVLLFLGVLLLIVVLVVGGLLAFAYINRNEIVRRGTERGLSFVLQVEAKVGKADLDLKNQAIQFDGIVIPNPAGYSEGTAMSFGSVRVEADMQSFRTNEPTIRLIELQEPAILLEPKGTTTNLQQLVANAQRLSSPAAEQPAEPPPAENQKAFKIEKVVIDGARVDVRLPVVGSQGVDIPRTELENIGGQKERVTPAEALQEILAAILERITQFGGNILPADLLNSIGGTLQDLPGDLRRNIEANIGNVGERIGAVGGEAVNTAGEAAGTVAKEAEKVAGEATRAVEGAVGAVGGLLGGRRQQEEKPQEQENQ